MDCKKLLVTSPILYVLKNRTVESFLDDSDDELDREVSIILQQYVTVPRVSIPDFFENVVSMFSEVEFIRYFRISRDVFDDLAIKYETSDVYGGIANQHLVTTPAKSLAIFLWFCGHECVSYRDLSNLFNITISTVYSVIRRMIAFVSSLAPAYIKWPNAIEMKQESDHHRIKFGLPGVIGAVDGTHIRIDPPAGDVTLLVQAVCNHENKFTHVSIGYPGSVHDAWAFRCSKLPDELEAVPSGYFILGDSAYPCLTKLLTPYRDNGHLTAAQKHFNEQLSKSRVMIEHSFGIIKQRFRQLYYCKLRGTHTLCHFIRSCFVLHNMSKFSDLKILGIDPETEDTSYPQDTGNSQNSTVPSGKGKRDDLCSSLYTLKSGRRGNTRHLHTEVQTPSNSGI